MFLVSFWCQRVMAPKKKIICLFAVSPQRIRMNMKNKFLFGPSGVLRKAPHLWPWLPKIEGTLLQTTKSNCAAILGQSFERLAATQVNVGYEKGSIKTGDDSVLIKNRCKVRHPDDFCEPYELIESPWRWCNYEGVVNDLRPQVAEYPVPMLMTCRSRMHWLYWVSNILFQQAPPGGMKIASWVGWWIWISLVYSSFSTLFQSVEYRNG